MASKDDASESKDVPWSSAEILDSLRLFIPLMVPLGKTSGNIALIATFFASLQAQLLSAIPSDGSVLVHVFFYSSIFIHIFAAFFGALATMLFDMPPPRAEPELPPGVMPSGSTMLLDVEWDLCPPSFYLAIPVVGGFAFLFLAFIGVVAGITVTIIGLEILLWLYQPLAVAATCTAISAIASFLLVLTILFCGTCYFTFERSLHAERAKNMLTTSILVLRAVNRFQRRGGLKTCVTAESDHATAKPGASSTQGDLGLNSA